MSTENNPMYGYFFTNNREGDGSEVDRHWSGGDDVYLEYYSGKGFHINYSVYMSYVKHINSSNKA
jgi:hypothetical protein